MEMCVYIYVYTLLAQEVSENRGQDCPEGGLVRGGRAREPTR